MGSVYRARDMHFPNVTKLVAVKEMINTAPDPLVRETIVQNFEREANLLATLHHAVHPPYLRLFLLWKAVPIWCWSSSMARIWKPIINETSGFLPEHQVLSWAIELCDVLDYLHKHKPDPIIFRDMKPSNVMINHNGDVMLVDFGIAKTFQTGIKGTMIGTEGYSPPEQYRGEATPSADIYALGATIHHALTRRDPRLEPPSHSPERPLRRINSAVSPEMEAVVNMALEYSPESRFRTAADMKQALMVVARKTGALVPCGPQTGPMRIPAGSSRSGHSSAKMRSAARRRSFRDCVYIGSYDNNLYALNAADGKFQWKYPTDGGIVSRPALFDGNIYFGSEDKRLHVVSARAGKVVWTYYTNGPIRSSPRIAEGHIFIGSDDQLSSCGQLEHRAHGLEV